MAPLPEYITLEEANRRYRIDRETLTQMIESGKIRAVRIDGRMAVRDTDVAVIAARREMQEEDELVSIKEASRRLGINPGFVSLWVSYGWVPVKAYGPRGAKLISLKRVATLAKLREDHGRRGRRLISRSIEKELLA